MFLLAVILCSLGALVISAPHKEFYDVEKAHIYFENFVQKYSKEYKNETERQIRFEIFKNNLVNLNAMNEKYDYVHAITMFTDLTKEEFNKKYNGYEPVGTEIPCVHYGLPNGTRVAAPPSFDWREKNVVTSVKNQGDCQSCWTFATAATMEGQYAIKYGQFVDFSEQQLLDCTNHVGGCSKGYFVSNAIQDTIQKFGGIMFAPDYPYVAQAGQCRADRSKMVAKVTGCRQFSFNNVEEMKEALVNVGPLAVAVNADEWGTYDGGVRDCIHPNPNHAVLVVGYGTENRQPYWIIKNSYGTAFGENGYIRLRTDGVCNLHKNMVVAAVMG